MTIRAFGKVGKKEFGNRGRNFRADQGKIRKKGKACSLFGWGEERTGPGDPLSKGREEREDQQGSPRKKEREGRNLPGSAEVLLDW